MLEWLALGGVAIAVYLIDCCTWTSARSWACVRRPFTKRWTAARGSELPGNERGGFSLCDPLSFSGAVVHCSEPPYSIGLTGVAGRSAASVPDPDRDAALFTFDQLADARAIMTDVYVGRDRAWRFDAPAAAQHAADHLQSLAALSVRKRPAAIRAEVERSMNVRLIEQTWRKFQADTATLRRLCWAPLAWVYVICPAVMVAIGPLASWPYLLGGMFASAIPVSIAFVKVHRKLFHAEKYDRWVHAISMSLFPIAAIRAVDRLSKDLLATFHPLAVVRAFCGDRAAAINRPLWFDISRGLASIEAAQQDDGVGWYRQVVHDAAIAGGAVDASPERAPSAEDPSMAAYCPRCHRQFGAGAAACSDCEGVELTAFAGAHAG
jgi:hypothetical protein